MTHKLNPSQQKAVEHQGSHLLIVAGPGTGKTHTLTHRIIRVAETLPQDQKILAITFTNKAAEEMLARAKGYAQRATITTFHKFCLTVLKEYQTQAGLPDSFRIASEDEIAEICKTVWPDKTKKERRLTLEEISIWKAGALDKEVPQEIKTFQEVLRQRSLLDFDDLLFETDRLLQSCPEVLDSLIADYPYVFVDEYQDINPVQWRLLKMLVDAGAQITAIGDPNQSIYGFRGSDVTFFESFMDDFPGAEVMTLSENYRSTRNLLTASSQVVANNRSCHVPDLTASIFDEGRLIIHESSTDKAEAEYVVHSIEKMVGGTSMFSQDSGRVGHEEGERSFGDIAVLYRLKSQCRVLEEAFDRSGMPYHIVGKKDAQEDDVFFDAHASVQSEVDIEAEKVTLMTLHAAKGLEFTVVFIVGCEQGFLPLDLEGMETDVEEERRLFYVGMTRAKEQLHLSHAKRRQLYGKTYQNKPSCFLSDIEEELKERHIAQQKKQSKKKDDQMTLF
ncbi:MAG: ATP-dependent helicase [Candidatus Omnitrophica bacterium]|nr:ATP-dependent helicase [Candidatus Omnitrophota bacterium]